MTLFILALCIICGEKQVLPKADTEFTLVLPFYTTCRKIGLMLYMLVTCP